MAATAVQDRVASRFMVKEAKRQHLQAIDFTLGLIRRLSAAGQKLPGGSNEEVIKRMIEMRRASQAKGFKLETLLENKELLSGKGKSILKMLETREAKVMPSDKNLAGFVKGFPNKSPSAQDTQAKKWANKIAAKTGEAADTVEVRAMEDWEFFQIAYDIVLPDMLKAVAAMDSSIGGAAKGEYKSREKAAPNTFKKQPRAGESFLRFKDLAGCMVITPTIANMAEVAVATQAKFQVVQKKNWYLKQAGFNAINFVFTNAGTLCEFQLKTSVNAMEAALSHDLIYAPEKAIVSLSSGEKAMVARVIDVSTQLSMREWSSAFDIAMKLARQQSAVDSAMGKDAGVVIIASKVGDSTWGKMLADLEAGKPGNWSYDGRGLRELRRWAMEQGGKGISPSSQFSKGDQFNYQLDSGVSIEVVEGNFLGAFTQVDAQRGRWTGAPSLNDY